MKKKKILTLDDLYNYYSSTSKRSRHFSSKDEDTNIVVQVPGNIVFKKKEDALEGLTPVTLQACHTGRNLNGSAISKEVMEAALPSFSNRPVLGFIHEVDGQWEFYDHTSHTEDGEVVYDERPIGVIPESCEAHLEYDEDNDKDYVVVNGYLFDEYSHATEILERDGECAVSVELNIRDLDYDAKEKVLNINSFYFSGVTALGKTPEGEDVNPGMAGANMKLADFTCKSEFSNKNVLDMLDEINQKLDQLSIDNFRKEEQMMQFEENVEAAETPEEETKVEETEVTEEEVEEATTEEFAEEVADAEAESEETEDVAPSEDETKFSISVQYGEVSHEYSATRLADVAQALTDLVNAEYSADGTFYFVDVYSGSTAKDKYVIMYDPYSEIAYRQLYTVKDGVYALKNERVAVHSIWVTDEEAADFEKIRSNYSVIENELNLYKAEPEKLEILDSEEYSQIKETEEYKELAKRESYFELDKEDLTKKLDEIILAYAKANKLDFAKADTEENKPLISMKPIVMSSKKAVTGRYGSLFAK